MLQPPSFEAPQAPQLVCKLHKALCGLKQAPRAWFEKLHGALMALGFTSARSDQSLFVRISSKSVIYLLFYVDDILITGNNPSDVNSLIQDLNREFALKDLGNLNFFLGIQATILPNGNYHFSQKKYITDLLVRAQMHNAKGVNTPMTSGQALTSNGSVPFNNTQLYRSIVGALQYTTITRPEITFRVCQFMQTPC